ncbi:MAG: (Fe-S)-binding protein, partial [Chloroflexi bacterium]|nr:(Fe-S)-binding protein [Chloroflexota bacterium]
MPHRPDFWGIPVEWNPTLWVYSIMFLAVFVLVFRFFRQARWWWKIGRPEVRWDQPGKRLGLLVKYWIAQSRVLGQRYPGIMHVAIAWAFFVFFFGTTLAAIDGHLFQLFQLLGNQHAITNPEAFKFLKGGVYLVFKLVLDLATVAFLVGAGMAVYRRFVRKPSRLTLDSRFTFSLVLVIVVVISGLVTESLRLAVVRNDASLAVGWWAPAGFLLAQLWIATGASPEALTNWHMVVWFIHLGMVVWMLVTLPAGTLIHILTSAFNTFFAKLDRPTGKLAPPAQNKDGQSIFVSTLRDMTWKQLLDADACTECGRCQDACPAHAAGTPLSPKQLILSVRDMFHQNVRVLATSAHGGNGKLVGEAIKDDVLWSCTTCGACVRECPVLIEHVDTIVDMRRHLVNEGQMDGKLQEALAKLGRYGNSFGQSERARAKWAQPARPKIKDARKEPVEYLWFVGDYASYSAGLVDVTRKTAEVFQKAGLDFGILCEAERNAGNDVRRVGEEGLFEVLVEKNVEAFAKSQFKTIVTTDPHSYNTLKHEYPSTENGRYPILHYAELLDRLIAEGKLKFNKQLGYKVTYHDPCYLGRYNGVYDAPRRVIQATGCKLVEMPRHGDRSFCCGAGGGRIWMEEDLVKERPSESRIREAVALDGVMALVVACPKD